MLTVRGARSPAFWSDQEVVFGQHLKETVATNTHVCLIQIRAQQMQQLSPTQARLHASFSLHQFHNHSFINLSSLPQPPRRIVVLSAHINIITKLFDIEPGVLCAALYDRIHSLPACFFYSLPHLQYPPSDKRFPDMPRRKSSPFSYSHTSRML